MSDQNISLALAFLQAQPSSAAAVLEQQPIEDVAQFLKSVPYRQSSSVLKNMLPQYTARICKHSDPAVAAGFLSEMDISLVAAIMRHTSSEVSNEILACLPESRRTACNILLRYSESAVGAWMATNFLTLPDDCNIDEARQRLSALDDSTGADNIYIVSRERIIKGVVSVMQLIKTSNKKSVRSLMQTTYDTVSGRTSLKSVASSEIWNRNECVAVVNRNHQIIGVLRHIDLRRGLSEISSTINESKGSDPIAGILDVYGVCLLSLFNTVGEAAKIKGQ